MLTAWRLALDPKDVENVGNRITNRAHEAQARPYAESNNNL